MLISLYQEGDENILDKHAKGLLYSFLGKIYFDVLFI